MRKPHKDSLSTGRDQRLHVMKGQKMKCFGFVSLMAVVFSAPVALAGEIKWDAEKQSYEWTSTDCVRPVPPNTLGREHNFPSQEIKDYEASVEAYIQCLAQEVQADFQAEQEKMFQAVQRDVNEESLSITQQVTMFNSLLSR